MSAWLEANSGANGFIAGEWLGPMRMTLDIPGHAHSVSNVVGDYYSGMFMSSERSIGCRIWLRGYEGLGEASFDDVLIPISKSVALRGTP